MTSTRNQQFLNELAQFYRNKGQHGITANHLVSRINGKPVNLWDLYSSVLELGGSYRVNLYNRWDDIYAKLFNTLPLGANVSAALRQIYQRFLVQYEKANSSSFVSESMDNDEEDSMPSRDHSSNFIIHSSLNQSNAGNTSINSQGNSITRHTTSSNPLGKLYCSLMSDLPNEIDFGLRVATILTNSKEIDHLADFKFIDVIVECSVMYACSCENGAYSSCRDHRETDEPEEFIKLKRLFQSDDDQPDKVHRLEFAEKPGDFVAKLKDSDDSENLENQIGLDNRLKVSEAVADHKSLVKRKRLMDRCLSANPYIAYKTCDCYVRFWAQICPDVSLLDTIFQCGQEQVQKYIEEEICPQTHQKNYYKVKRVAELIKNISYSIEKIRSEQCLDADSVQQQGNNSRLDFASPNLLRLLLLLLNCNDQSLVNVALDITANISPLAVAHLSYSDQYISLLTSIYEWCVSKVLSSQDIHCLNRCLEILAKLVCASYESINRLIISQVLQPKRFFTRLTELLTCQHDVGLLISCLDCCLSLSENYPKMLLQENQHLIKIIINLLNCEANNFFTSDGIQRIKIIDERKHFLEATTMPHVVQTLQPMAQLQPQQQHATKISITTAQSQLINESEQFAIQWLHSVYEAKSAASTAIRSTLKINDIYGEYFKHNCRVGRKNVIAQIAFGQVIKKAFPSVSFLLGGELDGLSVKGVQNTMVNKSAEQSVQPAPSSTPQPPLTSPILKAHLSTPPKSAPTATAVGISGATAQQQLVNGSVVINNSNNNNSSVTNTVVTGTTTSTSTLIKNMLANKLRNNASATGLMTTDSLTTGQIVDGTATNPINIQLVPTEQHLSQQNSISQSGASSMMAALKKPVQTSVPIANVSGVPLTSASPTTGTVMVTTQTGATNLITLPVQSNQNASTAQTGGVILTNHLQPGTKLISNPQQPQQFLLVRTIMPSQQNAVYGTVPNSSGPVRFLLPAGMITKPMGNNTDPNSVGRPTLVAMPTNNAVSTVLTSQTNTAPTMYTIATTATGNSSLNPVSSSGGFIITTNAPTVASVNSVTASSANAIAPGLTNSSSAVITNTTSNGMNCFSGTPVNGICDTPEVANEIQLGDIIETSSPSVETSSSNIVADSLNNKSIIGISGDFQSEAPTPVRSNQVKGSPLLNVLLDKGKLPEFSTLASGTLNSELNSSFDSGCNASTQQTNHTNNFSNQVLEVGQEKSIPISSQQLPISSNTQTIVGSLTNHQPIFLSQQPGGQHVIHPVTSVAGNSFNPGKMYILTTTTTSNNNLTGKANFAIKPANSLQTQSGVVQSPVPSFLIQQPISSSSVVTASNSAPVAVTSNKLITVSNLNTNQSGNVIVQPPAQTNTVLFAQTAPTPVQPPPTPSVVVTNGEIKNKMDVSAKLEVPLINGEMIVHRETVTGESEETGKRTSSDLDQEDNNSSSLAKKSKISSTTINSVTITPVNTPAIVKVPDTNVSIVNGGTANLNGPSSNAEINSNKSNVTIEKVTLTVKEPNRNPKELEYVCEWLNCNRSFSKPASVFLHVHQEHVIPSTFDQMTCLWGGSDGIGPGCQSLRPKYSLLTHVQDFHCNPQVMQNAAMRRQQLSQEGTTTIQAPAPPPAHPGYANNAAFLAIRRHNVTHMESLKAHLQTPTSALSTSIRLTAALILRNLAQHSTSIKS